MPRRINGVALGRPDLFGSSGTTRTFKTRASGRPEATSAPPSTNNELPLVTPERHLLLRPSLHIEYAPQMELADEDTHLALMYVAAATRNGGRLSAAQLEAYIAAPERGRAKYANSMLNSLSKQIAAGLGGVLASEKIRDGETMTAFLSRISWLDSSDMDAIRLSGLGKAILAELNNPKIDISSDSPISVVINPTDPFAYVRVFELISTQSSGLIIDPYFGFSELTDISDIQVVRRVLMSDHDLKTKRPIFERALGLLPDPPEVRYLPLKDLHDRFFIADVGDVLVFGSSLNSISKRPGVVTPIADETASGAIRNSYEQLWLTASQILPNTSTLAPATTAAAASPGNKAKASSAQ